MAAPETTVKAGHSRTADKYLIVCRRIAVLGIALLLLVLVVIVGGYGGLYGPAWTTYAGVAPALLGVLDIALLVAVIASCSADIKRASEDA